jgi:nucleotide-binding universal stress UspA family protein
MTSSKIAAGIDFSTESETAAGEALRIARHLGDELVLVHVSTPVDVPGLKPAATAAGDRALAALESYLAEGRERDRARLTRMRERLSGHGVHVVQATIESHPDSGLCTAARETGSELLVVGTHGHSGLKWFLLGSVAQRVIRMADLDVLVARNRAAAGDGYRRILVGTDFSSSSARALDRAVQLAAADAEIDVVHFYHHAPHVELYDAVRQAIGADLDEAMMTELSAAGQSFIGQRRGPGPTVRFYAVAQAPVPGLIHWLERQRFDLVALGSHGRRGARRLLLGSVAEAVARRAPCSTLIARGHPGEPVS